MQYRKHLAAFLAVMGLILAASWASVAQAATATKPAPNRSVVVKLPTVALATDATDAYHPGLTGGLDKTNYRHAHAQLMQLATVNPALGNRLAQLSGTARFNARDYSPQGYGRASGGTNTAFDNQGNNVPAPPTANCHIGAQVLIVINIKTMKGFEICTGCANPRLRQIILNLPQKPWSVETVMQFSRTVVKPFGTTCPSGQKVFGRLLVWVHGTVRGRTWGVLQGRMKGQMTLQLKVAVNAQVKILCGPAPPGQAPPGNCNVTVNGNNNTVINCVWVITVVCGGVQITFSGPDSASVYQQASQYVQANCVGTPIPPPAPCTQNCVPSPSPKPPPPTCQPPGSKACDPPQPSPPPPAPGPNPPPGPPAPPPPPGCDPSKDPTGCTGVPPPP